MNWRIVWSIFRKEALDTVRDRRTLIMMLGVPVVLYPSLMLLMTQVAIVQQAGMDKQMARAALAPGTPALLGEWLHGAERIELSAPADPEAALTQGEVDVLIAAPAEFGAQMDARQRPKIELRYDATEFRSRDGRDRVAAALDKVYLDMRGAWLKARGLDEGSVSPFQVENKNVASDQKTSGTLLGLVLPVLLVIMLALGAFYPAVDLTAGEKERGTFETLLSTPCTKLEIVTGKFLTVLGLALLTALLNFGSMGATLMLVLSQARQADAGLASALPDIHFDPRVIGAVLLVIVPLACLISAAMMAIAVFARSFKEAQNYMAPLIILIALPAVIAGLPGMELGGFATLVPVSNVVLLFKDLMTGEAPADTIFAVVLSTTVFAGLMLLFAAWLFQREEVVLGGGALGLSLDRAAFRPSSAPSPGMAMALFFGVMVLIMYLGTLAQMWSIFGGLLITEYLLILAPPVLVLWFFRVDLGTALSLRRAGPLRYLGALCCGLGGLVLVMQVGVWHNKILPVPQELQAVFEGLFADGKTPLGLAKLLLIVAITPAICEEVLFRGAMFSGLRQRMHPLAAVVLVGVLFGVFHLSIHRFASTALLGVVLTGIVWRTGSIFPGMLVHALVNGLSILLATGHFPESAAKALRLDTVETQGVWWPLLAGAVALVIIGGFLMEISRRKENRCSL